MTNAERKDPLISILLLNWNGFEYTRSCVRSLLLSDYPRVEIIIFDNGSDNNEFEKLLLTFQSKKNVRVYKTAKNLGYARGMNEAYKKSKGAYILVSNNDMKYTKSCLGELLHVLKKNPSVGICQPKLLHLGGEKRFDYSLAAGGYVDMFGYPFARGRIFTRVEADKHQYNTPAKISWCGIFMVKRDIIKDVGLFNSIYFNYGEDMDFCFRVYAAGYAIVNNPKAVAYHVSGGVLKKNMLRKLYFHHRNNIILMLINWPFRYLFLIFPIRVIMDFVTIFYYLFVNFSVGSYGILLAYSSIIRSFVHILSERNNTLKKARYDLFTRVPYYKGSIAFDHFVLKRQTFDELNPSLRIANLELEKYET